MMSEKITPQRVLDMHAVRKPSEWEDCPMLKSPTKGQMEFVRSLPAFSAEEGYKPLHDITFTDIINPETKLPKRLIVLRPDGSLFYVNTEGYRYCRYALRLPKEKVFPHGLDPAVFPTIWANTPEDKIFESDLKTPISTSDTDIEPSKANHRLLLAASALAFYLECKGYPEGTKSLVSLLRDAINESHE